MTAPGGVCAQGILLGGRSWAGSRAPRAPGAAPGSAAVAMKPCEEEEEEGRAAAAAGGGGGDPWKECAEVAVQLARRAGQVRAARCPRSGTGPGRAAPRPEEPSPGAV